MPGGDPAGGQSTAIFAGENGYLTCVDCHSVHDVNTVEPFLGDRLRSAAASDPAYDVKTNRLLRQQPTGADASVAEYGALWCAGCHKGRLAQHAEGSGVIETHPILDDETYVYDSLPVVTGVGSIATALGGLGQSNRGYVMPDAAPSNPNVKTALQEGNPPICQQCHEDKRTVGPSVRKTNPTILNASQEFSVTSPDGTNPADNPRFHVFPHESDAANLLVRPPGPSTDPYLLCLSCHGLRHDAAPLTAYVEVFQEAHDSASSSTGDGIVAPCATCHVLDLLAAHADQCEVCHPVPFDGVSTSWTHACQQGGCHASYHDGGFDAHWDAYDTQPCSVCHPAGWWPTTTQCLTCHATVASTSPPITSSNALASYVGAAIIEFTVTKGGKAAIATTFYRLDGGDTQVGSSALFIQSGAHTIEFWSVDQNGLTETPAKSAAFSITEDTTPPTTTSNAVGLYYQGAVITLSATDASTHGVKNTYFRLNGGPINTGTRVVVPATPGIFAYTLEFWSEDWSGNVEAVRTASFTVRSGTATIRFDWGSTPPAGAWMDYYVYRGPGWINLQASGSDGDEVGWDGITDVTVPVRAAAYQWRVDWGYPSLPWGDDQSAGTVSVTVPGSVVTQPY